MNDLISRQAVIDALMAWEEDSVWDEECLKHRGEPYWVAPSDVIEKLPSAQLEIVYCRDCKWYREGEYLAPTKFCFRLMDEKGRKVGYNFSSDDFCSYAEKRTDG